MKSKQQRFSAVAGRKDAHEHELRRGKHQRFSQTAMMTVDVSRRGGACLEGD